MVEQQTEVSVRTEFLEDLGLQQLADALSVHVDFSLPAVQGADAFGHHTVQPLR